MFRCQVVHNSTAIRLIAHDSTNKVMRCVFTSGQGYDYPNVNTEDFDNLRHAESIGRQFNSDYRQRQDYVHVPNSEISNFVVRVLAQVPNDLVEV